MGCQIGMATNVPERVAEVIRNDVNIPEDAKHTTLKTGLTYDDATEFEKSMRQECGRHCGGSLGGERVEGEVWSVYRIDW